MHNRIEYIDALRGYVMILVVLGHVPMYCYHHLSGISFSAIPSTFHLALFFFISGWFVNSKAVETLTLRYACATNDTFNGLWKVLKGKFVQLIVPTMVFYLLYCWINGIDVMDNLWNDKFKGGYWFCIVLFGFYLTLTITSTITKTERVGGTFGLVTGIGNDDAEHQYGDRYVGKI